MACGGPVDPIYGRGDDSWCPSCHAVGQIIGSEGQWPSPLMYGYRSRSGCPTGEFAFGGGATKSGRHASMGTVNVTGTGFGTIGCPCESSSQRRLG